MFEEADSLGVSQGQGRGFAQVFDSTYNPVFKEETARLIEKDKAGKKEIDRQLESIDGAVWFRDQPLVQEKIFDLQKYAQDNYRSIGRGNTNEALEYKKKIIDIKAVVTQSKLAEQETTKLLYELNKNENKYDRNKSKESLESFLAAPGNFDISQLQLFANFDAMKHQKDLASLVGKITQDTQLLPGFKDLNNNAIYRKFENTIDSEIERNARSLWLDLPESGREHYNNDLNKYIDIAKSYAKESKSQIVKTPYVDPNQKQQQKFDLKINNVVEDDISVPYGEEGSPNKIFQKGRSLAVQEVAGNFTENVPLNSGELKKMRAIPLTVFGVWKGTNGKIVDDFFEGEFWDKGDFGNKDFEPKKVKSMAVLRPELDSEGNPIDKVNFRKNKSGEIEMNAETTGGKKRWIPIENISISANDIKKGKFRGVKLTDDNSLWQPYIVGKFNKELSDNQTNFDVAIPYNEYKGFVGANPKGGNDIKNFEAVINEKNPEVLQEKTFSRGSEIAGIKPQEDKIFLDKLKDGTMKLKRDKSLLENYNIEDIDAYDKYLKDLGKNPKKTITFKEFIKL